MDHSLLKWYKSNQRPHEHHKAKRNISVVAIRLVISTDMNYKHWKFKN